MTGTRQPDAASCAAAASASITRAAVNFAYIVAGKCPFAAAHRARCSAERSLLLRKAWRSITWCSRGVLDWVCAWDCTTLLQCICSQKHQAQSLMPHAVPHSCVRLIMANKVVHGRWVWCIYRK